MKIKIREIPDEGRDLEGSIEGDILQLNDPSLHQTGPLRYRVHASLVSDSLLVRGLITAPFRLECVRCLQPIDKTIELEDAIFSVPIEDADTIDLTDAIREDILLALPVYPHCEDGTPPRECPSSGQFEKPEGSETEGASASGSDEAGPSRDLWSGLDQLKPGSPKNPETGSEVHSPEKKSPQ